MDYLIFLSICIVATLTPGPAVLLAIKNAISHGTSSAIIAIVGNVSAMVTMALISAIGLSSLLLASEYLFLFVKLVGGLYLIYLGVSAWRSSFCVIEANQYHSVVKKPRLFVEAYLVGISNPKAIVFYTALFPQFIKLDGSLSLQFAILTSIFAACSFIALASYAMLAKVLASHIRSPITMQRVNRLTGGLFIGFGSLLLVNSRT